MKSLKWIVIGLIILLLFIGGYYAIKHIDSWFDSDSRNSTSTELGERVDSGIAGVSDGIADSEGRAELIESGIDRATERADRLAEQRREMEARRKRIEERVAGLKTASDKIEAGLEIGGRALQRLDGIIRRLQERSGEEAEVVEVFQ